MTREEAIARIKRKACFGGHNNKTLCQWADEGFGKCEECENYMAIKALEQQPCEDCISRQAVKEAICDYVCGKDIRCVANHECNIKKLISELPSVTPKEKTGKWIRWYETIEQEHCTIHDPHCKCSECNQEYDPYIASLFNYCPNCGAKMQEVGGRE